MKTDNLIVIGLIGAAGLLVAQAMGMDVVGKIGLPKMLTGTQFGVPGASTFTQSIYRPFVPLVGQSYNPANPGAYIPNSLLINGTIHDIITGNDSSYYTPTINDITSDVLSSMYGTTGSGSQTVIRNPNYPSWAY